MKKKLKLNCVQEALTRDELRMIKGGGSGSDKCEWHGQPCSFLGRSGICLYVQNGNFVCQLY